MKRIDAVEAFKSASETIGTLNHGMHLFALTRGQFSMIDIILTCLAQTGPAHVSIWTWTVAEYEVKRLDQLRDDGRVLSGTLVIDRGARRKNEEIINMWRRKFGPKSVKFCLNHAKIATIKNNSWQLLIRGSMNLNFNPRFEQMDLSEGCDGYGLIKRIEHELPSALGYKDGNKIYAETKTGNFPDKNKLTLFAEVKTWTK